MNYQCQEIIETSRQQCRNHAYVTVIEVIPATEETPERRVEIDLCRLHFSFKLNNADFRTKEFAVVKPEDKSDLEALLRLHDKAPTKHKSNRI